LGLTYADADVNGKPIDFTLRTGAAAAAGSIVVILRHELLCCWCCIRFTNAGGTDAQITYPFRLNSILVKK
jgi:hypothetical protein